MADDYALKDDLRGAADLWVEQQKRLAEREAQLASRAKLMLRLREALINIKDGLSDEGDLVSFGSTNDADQFREAVDRLDGWAWHDVMKEAEGRDLYADLRTANARIAELESVAVNGAHFYREMQKANVEQDARIRELEAALSPFAEVAEHDVGNDETDDDIFRPISDARHARAKLLTVGDLRRARDAFRPREAKAEGQANG